MEGGGNNEADGEGDEAEEFDVLVAADAGGEVVGDLAIEEDEAAAKGHDS